MPLKKPDPTPTRPHVPAEVVSGDAMALSADLREAVEETWKRHEAGYRYLASEGVLPDRLKTNNELRVEVERLRAEVVALLERRQAYSDEIDRLRGVIEWALTECLAGRERNLTGALTLEVAKWRDGK